MVQYPGRDFFSLRPGATAGAGPAAGNGTGNVTAAPNATTPTTPTDSMHFPDACPNSAAGNKQVGIYLQHVGHKRAAAATVDNSIPAKADQRACQDECAKNTGITAPAKCLSFVYNKNTKACDLFDDTIDEAAMPEINFVADADSTYVQKVCVEENVVPPGTENALGELIPNNLLAGVANKTVTAPTLEECILRCFNLATANCTSGQWFEPKDGATTNNCVLNEVDRHQMPNSFGPNTIVAQNPMFYFGRAPGTAAIPQLSFRRIARDQKPIVESWTEWSKCTNGTSGNQYTYRYQICGEKDMSMCPRQVQLCPVSACAPVLNECRAVCDWNGHRRCPHGRMLRADGSQQYCPRPVDCDENSIRRH
jgi:hypothetical protein